MKIALLFCPWSIGTRALNFYAENIWISTRGLTGSELGIVVIAKELVKMNHEVHLFTVHVPGTKPDIWEGVHLHHYEETGTLIDNSFDAIVSWSEPDPLRTYKNLRAVKIVNEMLNDFTFCAPGFEEFVDLWIAPSERLKQHLVAQLPQSAGKWHVVPLGCDPSWYKKKEKIKGSVVSISSPDRGLHLLLQQWPKIKQAVPEATLKIFYHLDGNGLLESYQPNEIERHPNILELAQRVRYIKSAIKKLEPLGVTHIGSASRNEIAETLSESQVAICPLSCVSFSEGFSVATIETMAAGLFPVIGKIDCLEEVYGSVAPMIDAPVEDHLDQLTEIVIRALKDDIWRQEITERCQKFASELTWKNSAEGILKVIEGYESKRLMPEVKADGELVKLNIACGTNIFPTPGWKNYDRENFDQYFNYIKVAPIESMPMQHQKNLAKYLKEGGEFHFEIRDCSQGFSVYADNSVDMIYKGQAIEHYNPIYQIPKMLKEFYRILKPGGVLRMTTPDLDLLIQAYLNNEMDRFADEQPEFYKKADPASQLAFIIYGANGPFCNYNNYEGHFFLFNEQSMTRFLKEAGFEKIYFYKESGVSQSSVMAKECVDFGLSHSLIVESVK